MAGIYIHIPFCKQACYYCDFHFSTSMKYQDEMVEAIILELQMQKTMFATANIETIYFGGGTPSVLSNQAITAILDTIYKNYALADDLEITLEANPDDLTATKIKSLANTPINRLSIGVQSFDDAVLRYMNRSHNSKQALTSIKQAQDSGFENMTIDLIYGVPQVSNAAWESELEQFFTLQIPHLSAYALTVESKTALASLIQKGKYKPLDEAQALAHFERLLAASQKQDFMHYEISNFAKAEYLSKHNTAYWQGKNYLGIGPSAHSFVGNTRFWNIANNVKYIKSINSGVLPQEQEELTPKDQYNEYVMTQMRTIWGVDSAYIQSNFGSIYFDYFTRQIQKHIAQNNVLQNANIFTLSPQGKFRADGISSDLFWI